MLFAMAHIFPETRSKQGTRFLSSTLTASSVVSGMTLVIPGVSRLNWKRRNKVKVLHFYVCCSLSSNECYCGAEEKDLDFR